MQTPRSGHSEVAFGATEVEERECPRNGSELRSSTLTAVCVRSTGGSFEGPPVFPPWSVLAYRESRRQQAQEPAFSYFFASIISLGHDFLLDALSISHCDS